MKDYQPFHEKYPEENLQNPISALRKSLKESQEALRARLAHKSNHRQGVHDAETLEAHRVELLTMTEFEMFLSRSYPDIA